MDVVIVAVVVVHLHPIVVLVVFFFFQAEDGIRDVRLYRGLRERGAPLLPQTGGRPKGPRPGAPRFHEPLPTRGVGAPVTKLTPRRLAQPLLSSQPLPAQPPASGALRNARIAPATSSAN